MKKRWLLLMSLFVIMILFSACKGAPGTTSDDNEFNKQFEDEIQKLRQELQNQEEVAGDIPIEEPAEEIVEEPVEEEVIEEPTEEVKEEVPEETIPDETVEEEISEEVGELVDSEEAAEEPVVEEEPIIAVDTSVPTLEVKEGDFVNLKISADDPDEDTINFAFSEPLNNDGTWQTEFGDAGEYPITITASDGELSTSKEILLVVHKNNVAPDIDAIDDITITEGDIVEIDPVVSDRNGDEISLTISTPLEEGYWETDHTSADEYQIEVKASDGALESVMSFTLYVINKNFPPVITGLTESMSVDEGETVVIQPVIEDVDTPEVRVSISEPVGDSGIWETLYTDHGNYDVTVTADDGDSQISHVVNVVVHDINMPPMILSIELV